MAAMSLEATPECTPVAPRMVKSEVAKHVDWTPGQWSGEDTEDSQEDEGDREEAESLIAAYNEAMASLSEKTKVCKVSPLTFQLKSAWDEATDKEKEICTDQAMEGCSVICEIIAPNTGEELLRSCAQLSDQETERASGDLLALMQAYKNAPTANLKTQILSLLCLLLPDGKIAKDARKHNDLAN